MRRAPWPLLVLLLACDSGSYGSSTYPSGGGSVYQTHTTCGFWGNCEIEVQEVGGAGMRQRQAEAALACSLNSDCKQGMLCLNGSCSPECRDDRDCEEGSLCIPADHGWGECRESGLRVKLTEAVAIRAMRPAIERAQACFSAAELGANTEVRVHLTIDGYSGRVEGVNLPGSWESKPVGQCVAKEMASATFPPLTQSRVAYWYPVRAGVIPDAPAEAEVAPSTEGASTEGASTAGASTVSGEAPVADKLDAEQIRVGIASVRADIDHCFSRAGEAALEAVRVRVTVEGATGFVTQVELLDEAAETSLGACVSATFVRIEFPHFSAKSQRFSYKVSK